MSIAILILRLSHRRKKSIIIEHTHCQMLCWSVPHPSLFANGRTHPALWVWFEPAGHSLGGHLQLSGGFYRWRPSPCFRVWFSQLFLHVCRHVTHEETELQQRRRKCSRSPGHLGRHVRARFHMQSVCKGPSKYSTLLAKSAGQLLKSWVVDKVNYRIGWAPGPNLHGPHLLLFYVYACVHVCVCMCARMCLGHR